MIIAPEPKVHVLCEAKGSILTRVALSLSDSFSCEIRGADPSFEKFLIGWLTLYSRKTPPNYPFPLENFPLFHQKVLEKLKLIPFGSTLSYRELGKQCGNVSAARAVGGACKRNPFPLFIPCHRVICSDGSIGGFALDRTIKQRLLAFEGNKS